MQKWNEYKIIFICTIRHKIFIYFFIFYLLYIDVGAYIIVYIIFKRYNYLKAVQYFTGVRLRIAGEPISRQRLSDREVGTSFYWDTRGGSRSRWDTVKIQETNSNLTGRTRYLLHSLARDYRQPLIIQSKSTRLKKYLNKYLWQFLETLITANVSLRNKVATINNQFDLRLCNGKFETRRWRKSFLCLYFVQ